MVTPLVGHRSLERGDLEVTRVGDGFFDRVRLAQAIFLSREVGSLGLEVDSDRIRLYTRQSFECRTHGARSADWSGHAFDLNHVFGRIRTSIRHGLVGTRIRLRCRLAGLVAAGKGDSQRHNQRTGTQQSTHGVVLLETGIRAHVSTSMVAASAQPVTARC